MSIKDKPINERNSYIAYHDFNNGTLRVSMKWMSDKYGTEWFKKDPAELNLSFHDMSRAATIFNMGYDHLSVVEGWDSEFHIAPPYPDGYQFKNRWLAYINNYIKESFGEDYQIFKDLYNMCEKEHWGGDGSWKLLSYGSEYGSLVMSALKNFVWFKHMENQPITYTTATIIKFCLTHGLYWSFDERAKVVYDDDMHWKEIREILKEDNWKAHRFVELVLVEKDYERAFEYVRPRAMKEYTCVREYEEKLAKQ